MEREYLKNKKGSFSTTLSWAVATVIILILAIIYLFIMGFISSSRSSFTEILFLHDNFLGNGLEREFYTFLDEPILVGNELFSNSQAISGLSAEGFSSELVAMDPALIGEERYKRYIGEKKFVSNGMENYFRAFSNSRKSFLKNQTLSKKIDSCSVYGKKFFGVGSVRIYSSEDEVFSLPTTDRKYYGEDFDRTIGSYNCDPLDHSNAFSEAFVSKDKKIIYCFKY